MKEHMGSWYENNKEEQKRRNRERYLNDPEKERKYRRDSYHKNKNRPKKIIYLLWKAAKHRATVKEVPFSLTLEDIVIPEYCPILGVKIEEPGLGKRFTASIDRKIPSLGYTKDNIQIISTLANRMKWDASEEELELFCKGMLKFLGKEVALVG